MNQLPRPKYCDFCGYKINGYAVVTLSHLYCERCADLLGVIDQTLHFLSPHYDTRLRGESK